MVIENLTRAIFVLSLRAGKFGILFDARGNSFFDFYENCKTKAGNEKVSLKKKIIDGFSRNHSDLEFKLNFGSIK